MGDTIKKYYEWDTPKYDGDKPLQTRINNTEYRLDAYPKSGPDFTKEPKTASDLRIPPKKKEETVSKKLYYTLLAENIKLKEEVKYLQSLFEDVNRID